MSCRAIFGIDSHAPTTTICALVVESRERARKTFHNNPYDATRQWMAQFPFPAVGACEAGCTASFPPACSPASVATSTR